MVLTLLASCYPPEVYADGIDGLHPSPDGDNSAIGMCFRFTSGCDKYSLVRVKFKIKRVGEPNGTMRAALYVCSGSCGTNGVPSGAVLATSNAVLTRAISSVDYTVVTFTFPLPYYEMLKNTWYVIVLYAATGTWDNLNRVNVRMYTVGSTCPDSNGSYYDFSAWHFTTYDYWFEVWGECVAITGFKHSQAHIIG